MSGTFEGKRDAVLALDNEQLKQAVHSLAAASGMDTRKAEMIARDPEKIRKKLAQVTEREIERMLASLTPEQMAAIMAQLKQ